MIKTKEIDKKINTYRRAFLLIQTNPSMSWELRLRCMKKHHVSCALWGSSRISRSVCDSALCHECSRGAGVSDSNDIFLYLSLEPSLAFDNCWSYFVANGGNGNGKVQILSLCNAGITLEQSTSWHLLLYFQLPTAAFLGVLFLHIYVLATADSIW